MDDWKEAAATMAGIYENAYITIAATHSQDSDRGMFSVEQPKPLVKHPQIYVRDILPQFPRMYGDMQTQYGLDAIEMEEWPLLSRAWVYQERRLSRRIAHFARCQVYWGCKSCFISEGGSQDTKWTIDESNLNVPHAQLSGYWSGHPTTDWQKTVVEFSGLRLTYESDRLPAIAALAERMMSIRGEDDAYIAGMWKNSVLADLTWYRPGITHQRPVHAAPSWSWASVIGAVIWYTVEPLNMVEVVDVDFTTAGPHILGTVLNASITLKAPVIFATTKTKPPLLAPSMKVLYRLCNLFKIHFRKVDL